MAILFHRQVEVTADCDRAHELLVVGDEGTGVHQSQLAYQLSHVQEARGTGSRRCVHLLMFLSAIPLATRVGAGGTATQWHSGDGRLLIFEWRLQ